MRKAFYYSRNLMCFWLDGLNPEVQTKTPDILLAFCASLCVRKVNCQRRRYIGNAAELLCTNLFGCASQCLEMSRFIFSHSHLSESFKIHDIT